MSRVTPSPVGRPEIIANFYREEFLKHKRLLNRQREFYSERAITEVEAALARAIAQLEQLCHRDNADKVVSDLLRKLDVVTNLSAWSDPKNAH
ncbi:MAG: hypothetical protein ACRD1Q_09450 [Vicinamibacterales bacterium]